MSLFSKFDNFHYRAGPWIRLHC